MRPERIARAAVSLAALVLLTACAGVRPAATDAGTVLVDEESRQPMHSDEKFAFTLNSPFERVFPLFGAWAERAWAEGWNPDFVWPDPAADRAGMVFTLDHAGRTAIWPAAPSSMSARRWA